MSQPKYRPESVIAALEASRGMVATAARALGCSRNTIAAYAKRHAAVREALEDQRELMTDAAEGKLYDRIGAGDAWAVCFYLKTQGKERGYVERSELTGKDGAPLVDHAADLRTILADPEAFALASRLADRLAVAAGHAGAPPDEGGVPPA